MIPLPAAIAKHLRPHATLLVLPVEHKAIDWHLVVSIKSCRGVPGVYYVDQRLPGECFDVVCPLKPGETYTAPDGSASRVASVECRRVRSVTEAECIAAGFVAHNWDSHGRDIHNSAKCNFRIAFEQDHGAAAWGEDVWSWFITLESSERM